ncbi:MAG: NAD(P)-dependent oxidoreductase [Bacteroidota bacterium]
MSNNRGKVLIAAPVHAVLTDGLASLGYECIIHEKIIQEQAYTLIGECVGIITSTRLLLDKGLIAAGKQLQWIGRMGSGMEIVDVSYARQRGIACFSSPEGNCNAVGEHALGMLLALTRKIAWSNAEMKEGTWRREENRGSELEGKTVGIIGFGHTGQAFAKKLQGFDVKICAYDKYNPGGIRTGMHKCNTIEELHACAEIVSFHVPLQEDTKHYFNEAFVAAMQRPFILVNTSRGPIADTAAIYNGLRTGKITGACLDVFEEEPPFSPDNAHRRQLDDLMQLPNVVVTPHIAGYTFEALYKMSKTLLDKLVANQK